MSMEKILLLLIGLGAAIYVGRKMWRSFQGKSGCGGACGGASTSVSKDSLEINCCTMTPKENQDGSHCNGCPLSKKGE